MAIHSNGLKPFTNGSKPFEQLLLPIQKIVTCLNSYGYLFQKIFRRSNGCCYPFRKILHPFERLQLSVQNNNIQLFEWPRLSVLTNIQLFDRPLKTNVRQKCVVLPHAKVFRIQIWASFGKYKQRTELAVNIVTNRWFHCPLIKCSVSVLKLNI